jgi:hypothetical protein
VLTVKFADDEFSGLVRKLGSDAADTRFRKMSEV